ncbi:MAG TPA: hypothetical protein VHO90_02335, partial [Bacteroidales bacterium]|nr:hypothetical protein [Bacteroidales bacterium]
MKKYLLLLGILILQSIMFIKAQLTTSSKEYQSAIEPDTDIDLVTVGSIMPYKVAPFNWKLYADIVEVPIYKWWLNGNATGYKLLKCDGATPLKQLPPPNHVYYSDSSISIQWIKSGKYTLRVSEKVLTKKGIQLCGPAETIQTLDVEVIDRPLVTWPDTAYIAGCNLDGTIQNITFNITATKAAKVAYKVEFSPLDGSNGKSFKSDKEFKLPGATKQHRGFIPVSIPAGKYGIYKIYITGISDKVSEKSGISCREEDYPATPFIIDVRQGKELSLFDNKTPQTCQDVPYELKPVLPFAS